MKYDEKFEQVYKKILEENIKRLEYLRNEARKELHFPSISTESMMKKIFVMLMFFLILIITCFLCYCFNYWCIEIILIEFFVGIGAVNFSSEIKTNVLPYKIYKRRFKNRVIKELIDSFGEKINYAYRKGIYEKNFQDSEFERYGKFSSEDLITGQLKNNCEIQMSEIIEKGFYSSYVNFSLFCIIKAPKPFDTRLYIRKNKEESKNIIKKIFERKTEYSKLKVNIDFQEFEEYFDVYATDKIITMQLLTSEILELIMEFRKEMNFEVTIKNDYIYIRFITESLFEEPDLETFSLDKDLLYKYYKTIDFSIKLSNLLVKTINETEYDNK